MESSMEKEFILDHPDRKKKANGLKGKEQSGSKKMAFLLGKMKMQTKQEADFNKIMMQLLPYYN